MEECPSIYAELLLNIRQIAIYISFPAAKTAAAESSENKAEPTECTLRLADSGDSISLCYGGRTLNFNLPARVAPSFASMLQSHELPTWPCREVQTVSFRVPASLPSHVAGIREDLGMGHAWSARDMDISARICCRNCHHELVHSRIDLTDDAKPPNALCWKDLPSADWAELMELWHCHKPDEPHGEHEHDVSGNVKGYGASNQVVCNPGDVLVDVTSFYASEVNCSVIKEMDQQSAENATETIQSLSCPSCNAVIGETAPLLCGYRIFKARTAVRRTPHSTIGETVWQAVPVGTLVAAQLLEFAERIGVRRFAIYPVTIGQKGPADGTSGTLIWLFNTEMRYTSSITAPRPTQAVKVLYHELSPAELLRVVKPPASVPSLISVEEVPLPETIYQDLVTALLESQMKTLPLEARIVSLGAPTQKQKWNVALLDSSYEMVSLENSDRLT